MSFIKAGQVLHLFPLISKGFPYHPPTVGFDPDVTFGPEDIKILRKYGFNVVRLGMMWPGVEPIRNNYNYSYLGSSHYEIKY